MIAAIRKELAERKLKKPGGPPPDGGGGQGGGGGKQPLVPPIAELKMLRMLQLQINRRTVLLNQQEIKGQLLDKQVNKQHKSLADRERTVKEMTKQAAKNLK
jgi:hypothetical protein